jgi:hypothetical protein
MSVLAYLLINPAAGSTFFPADPFVITRIQIACVDENGPVVVYVSGVLRFEIFRIDPFNHSCHQVLHETNFWATRNPAHSIWRGRVARVADESGAAASKPPPECSWPPPSPAKFRERRASRDGAATFDSAAMRGEVTMTFAVLQDQISTAATTNTGMPCRLLCGQFAQFARLTFDVFVCSV